MFYIEVSNGLLTPEHHKKIGTSVWEFMWLLNKITKIDDQGNGWILGGKPVFLEDLANDLGIHVNNVSISLKKLEKAGYIKKIRTPRGLRIYVMKAKKRFNQIVESDSTKTVNRTNENVESNIRQDSRQDRDTHSAHSAVEINEVINFFKDINANCTQWYKRTTVREAVDRLLTTHGKEKLLKVIQLLPRTNKMPYLPTIVSPLQLEEKWASLEAGLIKEKLKTRSNIAFA